MSQAYVENANKADIQSYLDACADKFEVELRLEVGEELFSRSVAFYE